MSWGGSFTLTLAYGRVYTSKREVLSDIASALALHVKVRYGKRLEKVMVI